MLRRLYAWIGYFHGYHLFIFIRYRLSATAAVFFAHRDGGAFAGELAVALVGGEETVELDGHPVWLRVVHGSQLLLAHVAHQAAVGPQDPDGQDVRDDHDGQRHVERQDGAVEHEGLLLRGAYPAQVQVAVIGKTLPADGAADTGRYNPDECDLGQDHSPGLVAAVFHGVFEGEVAVHGHGAHVPDGGGAHKHI